MDDDGWLKAAIPPIAVVAFFMSGMVDAMSAADNLFLAALCAGAITGLSRLWDSRLERRIGALLLSIGGLVFFGLAWAVLGPAFKEDRVNEQRCAAVQADMFSAHPRLANGPDVFQALGCSPNGADPRIYVPPTDRERAAGRALPDGGYPPPR